MPLLAEGTGAVVQEVALEDVVSTATESGLLSDGKLDLVVATVPETSTIQVRWVVLFVPARRAVGARLAHIKHQRYCLGNLFAVCCFS